MVFKHLIKIVGNQNTTQYVLCQSQLTHSIHRIAITTIATVTLLNSKKHPPCTQV